MLHEILAGRKPMSAVMCLRVARLFGGHGSLARIVPVKLPEEVRA
jgi:hypothetical protein